MQSRACRVIRQRIPSDWGRKLFFSSSSAKKFEVLAHNSSYRSRILGTSDGPCRPTSNNIGSFAIVVVLIARHRSEYGNIQERRHFVGCPEGGIEVLRAEGETDGDQTGQ